MVVAAAGSLQRLAGTRGIGAVLAVVAAAGRSATWRQWQQHACSVRAFIATHLHVSDAKAVPAVAKR